LKPIEHLFQSIAIETALRPRRKWLHGDCDCKRNHCGTGSAPAERSVLSRPKNLTPALLTSSFL